MKENKYIVIVCWIMVIISLVAALTIHYKIDIWLQERITNTVWNYNFESRSFYSGLWTSILTGVIVSLATSYVGYGRAKHQIEFALKMNAQGMVRYFKSIVCGVYTLDTKNIYANILRFTNDFKKLNEYYENMILANNDYSPFIKNKTVRELSKAKDDLQEIWLGVCGFTDDILISPDEASTQKIILEIQKTISKHKEKIDSIIMT